ncbi:MAG TPA: hypothetical protein VKB03_07300 [Conexibacter sp.]|nr:hypothetical protein [Conexibacter sp.]
MQRAAAWIAVPAVCVGIAMTAAIGVELELWMQLLALLIGSFATGLAVGLRALWGASAIALLLLIGALLGRSDDYDMDTRAILVLIALFVFTVAAVAIGVGAFVRWVAAHATSRRASD